MKKQYNKPTMVIVNLKQAPQLLSGSGSGDMNAPEYYRFFPEEDVEVYE